MKGGREMQNKIKLSIFCCCFFLVVVCVYENYYRISNFCRIVKSTVCTCMYMGMEMNYHLQ